MWEENFSPECNAGCGGAHNASSYLGEMENEEDRNPNFV